MERVRGTVLDRFDPRGNRYRTGRQGRDRLADRFDRRLLPDEASRQGGRHDGQGRREAATKRITLSHSRTFEDAKRAEYAAEKAEKKAAADANKSVVKKINASVEKTTLGDIAGLAELKAQMAAKEEEEK